MRLTRKQQLESRIRDMKRKMLHQRDQGTRSIWKSHIEYLESEISSL